jgi:hypothetical protein
MIDDRSGEMSIEREEGISFGILHSSTIDHRSSAIPVIQGTSRIAIDQGVADQ